MNPLGISNLPPNAESKEEKIPESKFSALQCMADIILAQSQEVASQFQCCFEEKKVVPQKPENKEKVLLIQSDIFFSQACPLDILIHIFSFVNEPFNISRVCSKWRSISITHCFSRVLPDYKKIVGLEHDNVVYREVLKAQQGMLPINLSPYQTACSLVHDQRSRLMKLLGNDLAKAFLLSVPSLPEIDRFEQIECFIRDYNFILMCSEVVGVDQDISGMAQKVINQVKNKNFSIKNQANDLRNKKNEFSQIAVFSLTEKGLTSLPPEIEYFTGLQTLNLSKNHFTTLPTQLSKLQQLTHFDISHNPLGRFPIEIKVISSLKNLNVSHTKLSDLSSIKEATFDLTVLNASDNDLEVLPEEICQFNKLKRLNVSRNRIHTLPSSIGELSNLKAFFLEKNQLQNLPSTFAQLNLDTLCLEGNPLSTSISGDTREQLKHLQICDLV